MQDILEKMEKLDTEFKELRKEIMDLLSSIPEDTSSLQPAVVPQVEVWDTGKAWEQEYRLYPDPTRKVTGCLTRFGICSRLCRSGLTSRPVIVKI